MALRWWETANIVTQEATTTRRKAESLFAQMSQRQEQRRIQEEEEARRRKELSMKQTLEVVDSRRCSRAADEINEANKILRGVGLEPIGLSQSNVRAQVNSGFTWADNIVYQSKQANQQAIQDAEQKLRADVVGKLLKDGVVTVGSPADVAEPLIQAAIAQRKAEDALKAGDYEAAAQWQAQLQGVGATQGVAPVGYEGEEVGPRTFGDKLQTWGTGMAASAFEIMGDEERAEDWRRAQEQWGEKGVPEIEEEGTEIAEGIRVMPDYSVYSDDYVESIGRINPETLKFEQAQAGGWDKFKGVLSQLWKGIPLNPYYWMSPEEQQMADYKGQLLKWAGNLKGVENPEEFVENLLEPSGEVIMRALTDEDEGVEPPTPPPSRFYNRPLEPSGEIGIGEEFAMEWVAPMLILHFLKIPGPKQIREALKVPAWAGEKAVPRVAAQTVRGVLRPAEAIQTGIPRAIGGVVNRIPPLKRQFIEKPLENSIRNYLRQQGVTNPTQTQVNLYKQMIGQIPAVQTSAKLEQATMRALAQKFGNKAVGRYYTQGKRMSEDVIKDVIAHAKKTGNTDLQKGAEAFLQQWRASTTAEAQAELMRGDLFIKWMGELETGGVGMTDDVLSGLGRAAAAEVEGYYPALYHASMALEGEQAAHTLFVNNLGELFNIPVPDITASIVAKIFGRGALPVTASLIAQLANLGIPKATAEAMNSDEAWATLLRETLPELKQGAETGIEGIAEVTPAVAEEVSPTEADYMPAPVQQEFLARAETWLQQVPDVQPNTLHTVGVAGGEAFVRTDAAGNVEVAGISLMREETGKLTLSEVVAARPGGLAEREAGRDILNYIKENNIALPPREEMSRAAKGLLDKLVARGEIPEYAPSPVTPAVEPTAEIGWEGRTAPIEGVEVTVEGLEPVKIIHRLDTRFREKQVTYAQTKKQLVAYANEHLPLVVRGKMLTAVKNVKTELDLTKAIKQAEKYGEQYAQTTLRKRITTELGTKKIAARAQYGKFTPEAQRELNSIKANLNRDRENVKDEILRNIQAADEGKMTYEDAEIANDVLAFAGIKGMSSQELAYTLAHIKSLKETGRGLRAAEREVIKERMDALWANIIKIITGDKGVKIGVGTVDTRDLEVTRPGWKERMMSAVTNWQYGLDDLLDVLSKWDKTSKPYMSIISQLGIMFHLARSTQFVGVRHYTEEVSSEVRKIYDLKSRGELNRFLNRFAKEKITLGTFATTENKMVTLSLTKDQIIEKYLQLQDPTLEETFRIGMKWTDEMMGVVKDSMTAEDIKFAEWMLDFYQKYGKTIKPHYEAKYHQPWPENPYYSPLDRDLEGGVYEHILMLKDNFRYAGVTNNSLKARKKNQTPLRFNGATQVLVNHILQMEHFKAFAQPMKEARMVFRNKDVRTAIRQYHGRDILGHVDRHLDQIARDGLDKAQIHRSVDILRGHFTIAALGLKPIVSLKQAGSLPAYLTYEEMPIGDFFEGVADFWKNPIAHFREMRDASGYFADRWGRGHERDIRYVMQKGLTSRLSNPRNWRDLLMLGIRGVDTVTTSAGSWAVYKSMQKQGLSKENAILHAEIATKRSQPSFGLEDMAALRKHGSFWQLMTMFQSQPNKYYRIVAGSIRNLKYGRGDPKRQTLNILLAWWLLPAFFQFVSDAFQWKKEHQARVALLGPANYLLAGGQLIQSMWGWVTHEGYPWQASPVMSTVEEIRWAMQRTVKMIEQGKDPLEEVDTDYLIKTIEHYAKAAGQLAGVPTPYAVQLERAIRNADFRQLVFSEYALQGTPEQEAEKKALRKIQDAFAGIHGKTKWTELTKTEQSQFWQLRPDLKP